MKGTIISGEEVLKILGEGDLEKLGNVYEMVYTGRPMELGNVYEMVYTGGPMELKNVDSVKYIVL